MTTEQLLPAVSDLLQLLDAPDAMVTDQEVVDARRALADAARACWEAETRHAWMLDTHLGVFATSGDRTYRLDGDRLDLSLVPVRDRVLLTALLRYALGRFEQHPA